MLAVLAGGGLAACDPSGKVSGSSQADTATATKVTAYTAAFNTLLGASPQAYGGLTDRTEAYLGWDIASASPDDVIELELNPDWLPGTLSDLKAARAMRGDANQGCEQRAGGGSGIRDEGAEAYCYSQAWPEASVSCARVCEQALKQKMRGYDVRWRCW